MIVEIREICGDYGIYIDGEFRLFVNYRKNAEIIKAAIEADDEEFKFLNSDYLDVDEVYYE